MDNDISWTTIFHGQRYFMDNNISSTTILGDSGVSGESCDSGETELVNLVKRAFLVKSCKLGGSDESETVMSEWLVGQ